MSRDPAAERQVADALRRAGLSRSSSTLVVACSGGPDSTALLRCLHRLREDHGLTLFVAHLNHDFRGAEADHDAAFAQRLADGLGIPCSIDKRDPIAYQRANGVSSFEQAAREMRYGFLRDVAAQAEASTVALGHTADDQAETVLMHLLRGSGLQGLRGMSVLSPWPWPEPGPALFRPLLGLTKAEAAAYCRKLGQTFRQDSGNYMWRFSRNRVRLDLMPRLARDYNPQVREALTRLSRAAWDEMDYITGQVDDLWPELSSSGAGTVALDAGVLTGIHPALQRHSLRRAYSAVSGDPKGLNEAHIEAMLLLLRKGAGGRGLDLPRGIRASLQGGVLTVCRADEPRVLPGPGGEHYITVPRSQAEGLELAVGDWRVSLAAVDSAEEREFAGTGRRVLATSLNSAVLGDGVTVRNRRPGDRFQPSGMAGTKKLQDFFIDAKVPREQRDAVPLVVCERGIAWVVGYRVAEWAKPTAGVPAVRISFSTADGLGQ